MSEIKTGGPAFPRGKDETNGMKLRDFFAAQAMSGLLADPNVTLEGDGFRRTARTAYAMADAMLEIRSIGEPTVQDYLDDQK